MAKLMEAPRGVRIMALASILTLMACGGGTGGSGEGGSGGAAGKRGSGGSTPAGTGGGTGGLTGSGGAMTGGANGSGGAAGAMGTGGAAGLGGGGTAGGGGAAGAGGAAGTAGSSMTDAGSDATPDGGNGAPCATATDCPSGFCVDGVCCESACTDLCMACAKGRTGAADGLCQPIKAGTDPDNECDLDNPSTCGRDGTCNGAGACRKHVAGTVCESEACSGATDTPARTCDGAGVCQTTSQTTCGSYVCGSSSCKTSCASNADCATGNVCAPNGHCGPPQATGASCTGAGQCQSGSCVDGVCCENACTGACMACSAARTGSSDGLCKPVTAGTDPDNECAQDTVSTCGHNGMCDGAGACQLFAAGTACGAETCTGSTDTPAPTCDGAGTCKAGSSLSCTGYVCGATSCRTTCGTNNDCTSGYFCSAGHCVAKEMTGVACGAASDCQSGFCVDGVCCENACSGSCMTCNGVGTPGQCTPAVSGTDVRNDCTASATTTCGLDGTCDGAGACRKWGAGTTCGVASCSNGTLIPVPACDGAGTCVVGAPSSCGGYQCSATAPSCSTSCTSDAGCLNGFCAAGACIPNNSVTPVNLAGNGNLEYDTISGWSTTGGVLALKSGAGLVHGGTYSLADTGRTATYMGPSYALPTGAGKYTITTWAMQNTDTAFGSGALQLNLSCGAASTQNYPVVGNYGVSLPKGVWTKITGTVDFTATAGCDPSLTGGVVDSVIAYLNQTGAESPTATPDLFIDDLVVNVTDGHNLVGNPNFEAGTTAGWSQTGGTLAVSTAHAHGGTNSLVDAARTQPYQGQQWNLPIGTAKYNVSFYALHTGSLPHSLMLQPVYTCGTGGQQFPAPVATASNVAGGTWNQLSGTITFPPPEAPAGCQLSSAGLYIQQEGGTCGSGPGQVECPDIYVDDVSITLAP